MDKLDISVAGEKILIKHQGVGVIISFENYEPGDKPVAGGMEANGIVIAVKGL